MSDPRTDMTPSTRTTEVVWVKHGDRGKTHAVCVWPPMPGTTGAWRLCGGYASPARGWKSVMPDLGTLCVRCDQAARKAGRDTGNTTSCTKESSV